MVPTSCLSCNLPHSPCCPPLQILTLLQLTPIKSALALPPSLTFNQLHQQLTPIEAVLTLSPSLCPDPPPDPVTLFLTLLLTLPLTYPLFCTTTS